MIILSVLSGCSQAKGGLNISQRNVTVSTCGIVPGIRKLAEEDLQITLALPSMHRMTK